MRHFALTLCLCGLVAIAPVHAQVKIVPIQTAKQPKLYPVAMVMPHDSESHDSYEWLLGAWKNGKWVTGKSVAQQIQQQSWNIQGLRTGVEKTKSQQPTKTDQMSCGDMVFVHIPTQQKTKQYRLATSPQINTRPRNIKIFPNTHKTYQNIVRKELLKLGIETPKANITNIIRMDLDGNGTEEVILSASYYHHPSKSKKNHFYRPPARASVGDYSLLLLRSLQNGKVKTTFLHKDIFIKKAKDDAWLMPTLANIASIADLNGDGRMELVIWESYYEGTGIRILEWTPQMNVKQRLSVGCGS